MPEGSEPEEVGFRRRPAHTEAEDWIVYHPGITPTALMLYMRLRGAVMDPSSSAEDWKKTTRFTINEMRRLLPRAQGESGKSKTDSADPYVSDRTVQRNLGLLVRIGALRRVGGNTSKSQVPMYDFPMYPPEGHDGPVYGGVVGRAIRTKDSPQSKNSVVTISDQEGCHTCRGVTQMSGGGDMHVTGGCHTCHPCGPLTSGDGASKKSFKKNPLPPQEEEEDDHAARAMQELAEHLKLEIHGGNRSKAESHIRTLLDRQWSMEKIKALFHGTDWANIDTPVRFVVYALGESLEVPPVPTAAERLRDTLEELKARRKAQKAAIKACSGCGDFGRAELTGWHGHDDEDLKERIWALEDPAQAAVITEMNTARHKRAT